MNLAFFLWNAVVVSMEYFLVGLHLFQWIRQNLPKPAVTALVLSTALPVTHWFTADLLQSDYFEHGGVGFPAIVKIEK